MLSVAISLLISFFGNINYDKYGIGYLGAIHLGIFAGVFAVIANAVYIWKGLNGKLSAAGASVAHIGFGLFLIGVLISSSKKEVLSLNTTIALPFDPKSKENPMENQTLFKGVRTDMGKYWTTFVSNDSTSDGGKINYFKILFESKNGKEKFYLNPNLIKNSKGQEGFSNNPDAKHYWNRDIFSYISYADAMDKDRDTAKFHPNAMHIGDTIYYSSGYIILDSVVVNPNNDKYQFAPNDTALMAVLSVVSMDSARYKARPAFFLKDNHQQFLLDTVISQNLAIGFSKVLPDQQLEISIKESTQMVPFVALKVYQFPFIRLVWLGVFVMMVGFVMSIVRRVKLNRRLTVVS